MNTLEHIAFMLSHAVDADEIGKAEMRRILNNLHDAAAEVPDTKPLQKLNEKISKRFRHVIHPDGIRNGEDA